MVLSSALICLASNLFFESRGEPVAGQIAVAHVTMNRAKQNKDNVCRVVLKRKQFSWTATRVKSSAQGKKVGRGPIHKEPIAWAHAVVIAQLTLWDVLPNSVGKATHFHATSVNPYWASSYVVVGIIGNHVFYK